VTIKAGLPRRACFAGHGYWAAALIVSSCVWLAALAQVVRLASAPTLVDAVPPVARPIELRLVELPSELPQRAAANEPPLRKPILQPPAPAQRPVIKPKPATASLQKHSVAVVPLQQLAPAPAAEAAQPIAQDVHPAAQDAHPSVLAPQTVAAPSTSPTNPMSAASTRAQSAAAYPIAQPLPEVPDDLRELGLSAVALVRLTIHADGSVEVQLLKPTASPRLNQRVLQTLRNWRFVAAQENGRAVESQLDVRVHFNVN
jgi:protein TonB